MKRQLGQIAHSPVLQRLGRGIAAQGYGHAVAIGLQLAAVPILLSVWGDALYGSWLLLSAVSTYLTLSDLGFAQAATNDMTVSMANGRTEQARRTYQSLLALGVGIGGLVILAGLVLATAFPLTDLLNLRGIAEAEARAVIVILAIQVALAILNGGLTSGLRAEGRFATMSVVNNTARLAEGIASLVAAIAGGGVIGAAAAMLLVRAISNGAVIALLLRGSGVFQPRFTQARLHELRHLIRPSLSYLAFPIGNALMIQGVLTLVGLRIPAAVTLFATSRTLTRLGTTMLGSVNHVFLFDYGRTLGGRERLGFIRLLGLNALIIAGGLVAYVVLMFAVGPIFYTNWTAGRLHLDTTLLASLVGLSVAEALWAFVQTPLIAINAHGYVTMAYLFGAVAALTLGALTLGRGLDLVEFVCLQASIYLLMAGLIVVELYRRLNASLDEANGRSAA